MPEPLYSFRSHERAEHLEPGDIVEWSPGRFIEVVEIFLGPVTITVNKGHRASTILERSDRVRFLRPHDEPVWGPATPT